MERLAELTPYVLNAVGSSVEPETATAHGVLGAIAAWAGGSPEGLRVLVHGAGKVGGALARELVAAGATVLTCDRDAAAADIPGCRPVLDWAAHPVDVLAPCSVSDLIGPPAAERLRCGAVIGSANAVLAEERETAAVLARRGITFLPTALTNAGAVIVDSVEHYSPAAFRAATPQELYAFVRATVHAAAVTHIASDTLRPAAPGLLLLPPEGEFCGRTFALAGPASGPAQGSAPGSGPGPTEAGAVDAPAA
jgi:leucine dehydrogenase